MKKIKAFLKQIKRNPKLRCGSFSLLLTAGVILCLLLAGWLADALESRFALTVDLSFNQGTVQGEVTRNVLAQLEEDVHIYALIPQEGRNNTLLSLLERYAVSPRITVSEENLVRNPVLLTQFTDLLGEHSVSDDCLIVHCPGTGRSRILNSDDYYTYDIDPATGYYRTGYINYEKCITEAIVNVTQQQLPTIQILTGHGELNAADTIYLEETLANANYQVERINLLAGGKLDPASLLMILCPQYDLAAHELTAMLEFSRAGGNFFILTAYDNPLNLTNFNALLRAFGANPYPGLVIAMESDSDSYFSDSPVLLMPYMQETDATRSLLEAGKNLLILSGGRAFRMPEILPEGVALSPVLVTGEAYIRNYLDGLTTTDQQPTDETGRFALALWAEKIYETSVQSRAFIMGEEVSFLDYHQLNSTDSKPFLIQMVRALHGQSPINLDILPKSGQRESLYMGSLTPAVVVIIMLPLLILIGAAVVLLPRKNL